jgi:hypothetical protein
MFFIRRLCRYARALWELPMTEATQKEILDRLIVVEDVLTELRSLLRKLVNQEKVVIMNIQDIQSKADSALQQIQSDTDTSNQVLTVVNHQNDVLKALQQQIADLQASGATPEQLQALSDTIDNILATDMANGQVVASAVSAGSGDPSVTVDPNAPPVDPSAPPVVDPNAPPLDPNTAAGPKSIPGTQRRGGDSVPASGNKK